MTRSTFVAPCLIQMKTLAVISLFLLHGLMEICICKSASSDYRKFGVQTSYFENANLNTSTVHVAGCEPVYFWFLARHGARYPREELIEEMKTYLPGLSDRIVAAWKAGNGRLDEKTVELFKVWNLDIPTNDDQNLTESGEREHRELGSRWRRRLEGLLHGEDSVLVRATNFERTRESARHFLKGVFQTDVGVPPSPKIEDDLLLREGFWFNCPNWRQGLSNNSYIHAQRFKLERSQDYKLMLEEVGDRVGLVVTPSEVVVAWEMCRFETAWSPNETSPWCRIYSPVNLRLMEFSEVLEYYYLTGYGSYINSHMTQPIFEDIFQKFEEIEEEKGEYKAALYFAHDVTILPVLAALGLYRDQQPLRASDWPESQDYQWRTSFLASFAANLGLVLLECDSEEENRWKVMAYHQERTVVLPACGQEVCTLQQFKQFYSSWTNLDFHSVCN